MANAPQSEDEARRRNMVLLEQIIDKATSDRAWKEKLLSDPQAAFDEAGLLPEIDALSPARREEADVVGQATYLCVTVFCPYTVWYACAPKSPGAYGG